MTTEQGSSSSLGRSLRSDRVAHLRQPELRKMTRECVKVGGINMGQGICDLPTPPSILEAASQVILADKYSTYSKFEGIDELRVELAKKYASFNKLDVDPDSEIVVTVGATGGLVSIVQALFNPGDEVILFEPFYEYHVNTLLVGGLVPKFVTLKAPDWQVTKEAIEAQITPKTRAILFSNPTNPSGKVFRRQELELISQICIEHDLLALADEIYEYIVYDGQEHISIATIAGMADRTVTMSGFSKTFSITGWRLGTIVTAQKFAQPIGLVNDLFYVCAPTPLQYGVARGLATIPDSYYVEMSKDYEQKRDLFCDALLAANLVPIVPQGAYYVLVDVSSLGFSDSRDAAMHLLHKGGVASVPGMSFYQTGGGDHLVRFCYAKDWDTLRAAAAQISAL